MGRVDQNRLVSPHVEPDTRRAAGGKAKGSHAALARHANFKKAIFGRQRDRQPLAIGIVFKHIGDLKFYGRVSLIQRKNQATGNCFTRSLILPDDIKWRAAQLLMRINIRICHSDSIFRPVDAANTEVAR